MRLGICTRYHGHEATYAAIRLANWGAKRGYAVSLFSPHRPRSVGVCWDNDVLCGLTTKFTEWSQQQDCVIWTHAPPHSHIEWVKNRSKRTAVLALWHEYTPQDRQGLREADVIITPHPVIQSWLRDSCRLRQGCCVPWDSGFPSVRARETGEQIRIVLPLYDGNARRISSSILAVLDSLLDSCGHVCLRIPLNASTITGAARRDIERLQRYFPGRVESQPRARFANRPQLFGECDLTLWPTAAESLGLVGLTSLAAGVPVITFNAPPMDAIVQPLGGALVPVTTILDDYGVPQYRPAWEALYDRCVELVNDRETIQAFKQNIVDDERDRAKMFDTSLETAIEA